MTRTESPRSRWLVMAILAFSLGLGLTLAAEPDEDAGEPREEAAPSPLRKSLHEALRLLDEERLGTVRIVPADDGELIIEVDRAGSSVCLAGLGSCRAGEAISRMPACREPGGCAAYETWTRLYGAPRLLPARPEPSEVQPGDAPKEQE